MAIEAPRRLVLHRPFAYRDEAGCLHQIRIEPLGENPMNTTTNTRNRKWLTSVLSAAVAAALLGACGNRASDEDIARAAMSINQAATGRRASRRIWPERQRRVCCGRRARPVGEEPPVPPPARPPDRPPRPPASPEPRSTPSGSPVASGPTDARRLEPPRRPPAARRTRARSTARRPPRAAGRSRGLLRRRRPRSSSEPLGTSPASSAPPSSPASRPSRPGPPPRTIGAASTATRSNTSWPMTAVTRPVT